MDDLDLDGLREQIRAAFPLIKFEGTVTDCNCDECVDLRNGLGNRQWDEIPTAFLDFTCSPMLLTPEAFAAFIPAYMLRSLDDLKGERATGRHG